MLPAVNKWDGGDNQTEYGCYIIKYGVWENIIPPLRQERMILFYF